MLKRLENKKKYLKKWEAEFNIWAVEILLIVGVFFDGFHAKSRI
jgi:hypothetical protein